MSQECDPSDLFCSLYTPYNPSPTTGFTTTGFTTATPNTTPTLSSLCDLTDLHCPLRHNSPTPTPGTHSILLPAKISVPIALGILLLILSALGAWFYIKHKTPPPPTGPTPRRMHTGQAPWVHDPTWIAHHTRAGQRAAGAPSTDMYSYEYYAEPYAHPAAGGGGAGVYQHQPPFAGSVDSDPFRHIPPQPRY